MQKIVVFLPFVSKLSSFSVLCEENGRFGICLLHIVLSLLEFFDYV